MQISLKASDLREVIYESARENYEARELLGIKSNLGLAYDENIEVQITEDQVYLLHCKRNRYVPDDPDVLNSVAIGTAMEVLTRALVGTSYEDRYNRDNQGR